MASPTQWTWVWASSRRCDGQGNLASCSLLCCKELDTAEWPNNKKEKWKWKKVQVLSHVRLCNPTDYTVHGILQARILEWVTFPFSRGSSQPRDRTQVCCIAGGFFTNWASRKAPTEQQQPINRYWLKDWQDIQTRLYWGPSCSDGEGSKATNYSSLFAGPRGEASFFLIWGKDWGVFSCWAGVMA